MTIQTRHILIYGVGSAFFLIVFALLVFNRLETSMINQLQQQFEADARSKLSVLQQSLSQTTERFRFHTEMPVFRTMRFNQLTLNNAALRNDIRRLELYFLELQQNHAELRTIRYLDAKGSEILRIEKSSMARKLKDMSQDREVQNALELEYGAVLVTTLLSDANKVSELIWWIPVFASLNVSSGVLGFHVSFDSFCNRIVRLGGWESENIIIEDGKGGSLFSTGSVEPYGRSADTKWKVSDTLGLPGLPWKVTISADPASFLVDVNRLRWQVFLIILPVIILLSLVTIIFTSRRITGNIRKLVKASELIGSGNLDYRVDVKTKDEFGKLSVAFNRMVEDLKKSNMSLQESEKKYGQVITTAKDAVMIFDAETRCFTEVNKACEEIYGYKCEEFLNMKHTDITAEVDDSENSIKEAITGKLHKIPLSYHIKKDGTVFPVEISVSVFVHKGRNVLCGIVRDITVRKKEEAELMEYRSHLESLVEERTAELQEKVSDLERYHDATVDRELRMKELRNKIEELDEKLKSEKRVM